MIPRWRCMTSYSIQTWLRSSPVWLLTGPLLTRSYGSNGGSSWRRSGNRRRRLLRLLLWLLLLRSLRLILLIWILNSIISTTAIILTGCTWPSCNYIYIIYRRVTIRISAIKDPRKKTFLNVKLDSPGYVGRCWLYWGYCWSLAKSGWRLGWLGPGGGGGMFLFEDPPGV